MGHYTVFVFMTTDKNYLIIFGSLTGNARRVAELIQQKLDAKLFNSKDFDNLDQIITLNHNSFEIVFVASTWGDGELQSDMENLLINSTILKSPAVCHIVELGNYYGYDDFEFGALFHIKRCTEQLGFYSGRHLSLDSMPRIDWDSLSNWLLELR